MDFQKLLLDIGKALDRDEVKALTFLCTDLLSRNPNLLESASDLFSRLIDQDRLSAERPQLLTELLLTIERPRLARELGLAGLSCSIIPPYRKLLYNLSEEITADNLRDIKFLLNKDLSRRKLEDNVTTLEVFLEMEHKDLISETNLNQLETIFKSVCPMLNERISSYKAKLEPSRGIIAQEEGRGRSLSYSFTPTQPSQSLLRTGSLDMPEELPPSMARSPLNSSNTSIDVGVALVNQLDNLCTERRRNASMRSDASEPLSSEVPMVAPVKQPALTTNTNNEGLGTYPMTGAKRGVCMIINNYDFTESIVTLNNREGTMFDEKSLKVVFEWLGFEVQIHKDCDKQRMVSALWELGMADHSQMDCVVCCVLSHGLEGGVYGADGNKVKISDITDPFDGINCRSLIEKPKLFFIQACQGNRTQRAVHIEADSRTFDEPRRGSTTSKVSVPSGADYLVGMATVPSYVSFRQRDKGTWFIQSLCQNLIEMVPRGDDLVTILTKVNADVSQKSDPYGAKKQMPQPAFSLRKKVVFPIPTTPPPSLLH